MPRTAADKLALLEKYSKPVNRAPDLIYSVPYFFFAKMLTGGLRDPDLPQGQYIKMYWFICFIPIIPLGIFLVSRKLNAKGRKTGTYYFHRRVKIKAITEIWGGGAFWGLAWQSIASYLAPWALIIGGIVALAYFNNSMNS